MSNAMMLLTPLVVFLIVALLGFVGCTTFTEAEEKPAPTPDPEPPKPPDPVTPPPGPVTPPPPVITTYEGLIRNTTGFAAFWPLNEAGGTVAAVVGSLSPGANGDYKDSTSGGAPVFGSYALGKQGVLFPKDAKDFAAEFNGTGTLIEVPFNGQLNPDPMAPGFSVELWVKPDPNAGADRGVLVSSHHFETVQKTQGYEIGLLKVAGQTHHQIFARVYSGTGTAMTEVTVQPDVGDATEWRHIVLVYEYVAGTGPSITLHVQLLKGAKVYEAKSDPNTTSYEKVTSQKPSTLRFASSHPPVAGGGVALFAGRIDNIAIYSAPLKGDIKVHYDFVNS